MSIVKSLKDPVYPFCPITLSKNSTRINFTKKATPPKKTLSPLSPPETTNTPNGNKSALYFEEFSGKINRNVLPINLLPSVSITECGWKFEWNAQHVAIEGQVKGHVLMIK
jgi:hypothetical protein